jgi:hypothetical protein
MSQNGSTRDINLQSGIQPAAVVSPGFKIINSIYLGTTSNCTGFRPAEQTIQ